MTPERLRECLGVLNWSTAALAAMADIAGHRAALAERSARNTKQGSRRHGSDGDRSGGTLFR